MATCEMSLAFGGCLLSLTFPEDVKEAFSHVVYNKRDGKTVTKFYLEMREIIQLHSKINQLSSNVI